MRNRSATLIALSAGIAAAGFAFISSAGAEDQPATESAKRLSTAVFAGGCFWCTEADFDKVDGVIDTISGYTGGDVANPTYKQVSHETTGHYESVKVTYDSDVVSYDQLVTYFLHHIDPTDAFGQFCDKGDSYRSAIFVANDEERQVAESDISAVDASRVLPKPVVTKVLATSTFWPAEDYHQNYYKKNPLRYSYYRSSCGRDKRIEALWGDAVATH
ncbi:peptide-methionine (S)-S-oxide reductase MsrA [Hyphomonas johnsonii]|jgi:peptide-methionine (S)-S-oxide reductase|uniref:Peptide methionine sulfoxide reductase MsrA n=1 Tax=Hyphomonas johnsonii MHS-2 TaxID=1280950 RepID=A0A059FJ22_9PROT|nr:peptide-methionine (S)-S-oxide reductase MsrA [Hyphomonas johnsonii]KCZ90665.1 peptide methionine sulfoxide reductase [Hyphomonas johnsonii MHS-2]